MPDGHPNKITATLIYSWNAQYNNTKGPAALDEVDWGWSSLSEENGVLKRAVKTSELSQYSEDTALNIRPITECGFRRPTLSPRSHQPDVLRGTVSDGCPPFSFSILSRSTRSTTSPNQQQPRHTPLENNGRGDALIICVVLRLFAVFIVVSEEARRWATATLQNTRQSCRYSSLYGALHERRLCRRRHRSRHPCVLFNTAPNVPSVHKFSATITTVNMCRKDTFTISHIPYIHSNHIDWFYTRF